MQIPCSPMSLTLDDESPNSKPQDRIEESLELVKKLTVLPEKKEIKTENGIYLNHCVTIRDLNTFLEAYTKKRNYAGVSFSMGTNKIYDQTFPNQFFTAVYFKKEERSIFYSVQNFFNFASCQVNLENRKEELKRLVSPMIDTWGYSSIQIGSVDEEFLSDKQTKSDYDLYLLLFYKDKEPIVPIS